MMMETAAAMAQRRVGMGGLLARRDGAFTRMVLINHMMPAPFKE